METLLTGYPAFIPNQVLTSTQLNNLRNYLDQQTRLSRARLLGTGVACGLTWAADGGVALERGFGITSAGYLAEHSGGLHGFVREYEDPGHDKDDENKVPYYAQWRTTSGDPGQIGLLELLDSNDGSARPLTGSDLAGRVVVLYLELASTELDSCLATDCDNMGNEIAFAPRLLLARKADIIPTGRPAVDPRRPASVEVPRLHTIVALDTITSRAQLEDAYSSIISNTMPTLLAALEALFDDYAQLVDVRPWADVVSLFGGFRDAVLSADAPAQYRFDAVKDLSRAHNEAAIFACRLAADCDTAGEHPRHLALGAIDGSPGFRHRFIPSPLRDVFVGDLDHVQLLLDRLVAIAGAAEFDAGLGVRLTPSQTEAEALGEGAIPFYYSPGDEMVRHWQPQRDCTIWPPSGYHNIDGDTLSVAYNRSRHIRIEGHVGLECDEAGAAIAELRAESNAEFGIRIVPLRERERPGRDVVDELARLRAKARSELRMLLAETVAEMPLDWGRLADIDAFRTDIAVANEVLLEEWRSVATDRCRTVPDCDHDDLELAYLRSRAELICRVTGLLDAMDSTPRIAQIVNLPDNVDERSGLLESNRARLAELESALGSVVDPDDLADLRAKIRELKSEVSALEAGVALSDRGGVLQLIVAFEELRDAGRNLLSALPDELCAFDYHLLATSFKAVEVELVTVNALATYLADPMSWMSPHTKRLLWLGKFPNDAFTLAGCSLHDFALAWFAFEQLLMANTFAHTARRHLGVEHLAGVGKAGTFLLVCDEDDRIVADFTLSGTVPCCSVVDVGELCLPPTATTDVVVVELGQGFDGTEFGRESVLIDVLGNDYQLLGRGKLTVNLTSDVSALGARIDVLDEGRILYLNEEPLPGSVDHFEYVLVSDDGDCVTDDVGHVVVVLRAAGDPEVPIRPDRRVIINSGDAIIDHLASSRRMTFDDARAQADRVLRERADERMNLLKEAASQPGVANSTAFKAAATLLSEVAPGSTATDAELAQLSLTAFKTLATGLRRAGPTNMPHFKTLMIVAAGAVLDRVVVNNPATLSPIAEKIVVITAGMLGASDLSLGRGRGQWERKRLEDDLGVKSTAEIGRLLA